MPEELQPPSPPRQTYRIRRRRTAFNFDPALADPSPAIDRPIPTIETPDFPRDGAMGLMEPSCVPIELMEGYLAPATSNFNRYVSPPRTPEAQLMKSVDYATDAQPWAEVDHRGSLSRPMSSCSGISDSSISSRGSFGSYPSYGDSCTSPEDDMADPFSYFPANAQYKREPSPLEGRQQLPAKPFKMRTTWSEEMDRHLWMTYNKYLQDPTVTPFKVPPGKVPPNGVCHRVARMASKTWKGPRSFSLNVGGSRRQSRAGTPDTIKPGRSGTSTPIAGFRRPSSRFPSQGEARKRLRYLCKHKPSLSAHYQRLLNCKSPSPERSSPQPEEPSNRPGLSSPFSQDTKTFSTRDMNISLATSTAASMQFGNPLSQLANDRTPRPPPRAHNDWSKLRASAHQKSQSLHIGLGIGQILESSFGVMSQMTSQCLGQHAAQTWHAPGNPPLLDPPLELHSPMPLPRPFKRRALHNFEDEPVQNRSQNLIDQLFGAPAEISHRRVRSRGFSLGDVGEGARQLSSMFTPPSTFTNHSSIQNLSEALHAQNTNSPTEDPHNPATIRLGSPFGGKSSNNTFPRASTSHGFELPASFEQRFAGMPSDPDRLAHH